MRPGPIFDNPLKQLAASEVVALCRWLGIETDSASIRVSETPQRRRSTPT